MITHQRLYSVLSACLVMFAGWTAAVHVAVLCGAGLDALRWMGPVGIGLFALGYGLVAWGELRADHTGQSGHARVDASPAGSFFGGWECLAVWLCVGVMVALTLGVTRSDLDDSFYAAVAANAVANPQAPLLASDPMTREAGSPLLFHSYRFSSFELLVAAVARMSGWHTLDVYYVLMPAVMAMLAAFALFALGRALLPQYWVAVGVTTLLAMLVLGEPHRGPANFSFARLFQGKAVFVSLLLPVLYAVTHRLLSREGRPRDAWVLACGVLSSIGMTNFGMLAAPMAIGTAVASCVIQWRDVGWKRFAIAIACMVIPLPYLLSVAAHAEGSALLSAPFETPWQVLRSVLGSHQGYLVGLLMVSGPVLARDPVTRWRLAVPFAILVLVYLNPWLSRWIAAHVTTPAVYWRVTWSLPLLGLVACGWTLVWVRALDAGGRGAIPHRIWAGAMLVLLLFALPFHTLRPGNQVSMDRWAQWKIPLADVEVAQAAVAAHRDDGRLLAPDDIAGVVSRFPRHPVLVSVREHYIDLLGAGLSPAALAQRRTLHRWVTGRDTAVDAASVQTALEALCVTTVVVPVNVSGEMRLTAGVQRVQRLRGYDIWRRPCIR